MVDMYTTRQAGLYLGISEAEVRAMIKQGTLMAWSSPRQRDILLVRRDDLRVLRQQKQKQEVSA